MVSILFENSICVIDAHFVGWWVVRDLLHIGLVIFPVVSFFRGTFLRCILQNSLSLFLLLKLFFFLPLLYHLLLFLVLVLSNVDERIGNRLVHLEQGGEVDVPMVHVDFG